MTESTSITAPTLVSLLVCDQVIDDRLTSKKSAIGLFNAIIVSSFPTRVAQLAVMATLTEIIGSTRLRLRLVRDEDNEVLMETNGKVEAPDPLSMVDLVFVMQGVPIANPGQYAFELLCDDDLLGRRRFHVRTGKPPAPRGGSGPAQPS